MSPLRLPRRHVGTNETKWRLGWLGWLGWLSWLNGKLAWLAWLARLAQSEGEKDAQNLFRVSRWGNLIVNAIFKLQWYTFCVGTRTHMFKGDVLKASALMSTAVGMSQPLT